MAKAKTLKDQAGNVVYPVTKASIVYRDDNTTTVESAISSIETGVSGKEPAITAGTTSQYFRGDKTWQTLDKAAVGLSNVDNKSEATIKTDFTAASIAAGENGFTTGAQVNTAISGINTKLDESYLQEIGLKSGASTTTVELTKAKKNINTGATTSADFALPVASTTQAGVVNATTFQTIQDSADKIDAMMGGSVAIEDLPANPTQAQLTNAWKTATGKTEIFNQAGIFDVDNNKIWTYYGDNTAGTWYYVNAGGAVVSQWGLGVAGIITGSADTTGNEGKLFAETDGTGSVIGWDNLVTAVTNNTNNISSLETEKEDAITAGTSAQYFRGDKTWQTLDKAAVGLANVDNTSDATKKTNFTATAVASGDNGFTTGNQVYTALSDKASFFATNPAIEDITA